MSVIANRLRKNNEGLKNWRKQHGIEAYRLYDRDIPEYPFIIDRYQDYFLIYDRRNPDIDFSKGKSQNFQELITAINDLFAPSPEKIILKRRERQKGENQYEKLDSTEKFLVVQEGPANFYVNLWDYIDTGLFLDHRPIRTRIMRDAAHSTFLNLFSYTGSVSVFAALGGAKTTSIDMSATYTDWSRRNFELNKIPVADHEFLNLNAIEFIRGPAKTLFTTIFLDPPTFSNSKKMTEDFDVERDHEALVRMTLRHLQPKGTLFFSNNKRDFRLSPEILRDFAVTDITEKTIPRDFRDSKIHKTFEIQHQDRLF